LQEKLLEETNELLREIKHWLRAGFHSQVQILLESVLDTPKKRLAYQMADGSTTVKDVCKTCSMSTTSVLGLWNEATRKGLIEVLPGGKRQRLFDLNDFGLFDDKANSTIEVTEDKNTGGNDAEP
jgi:predicted Rossmann fold nucleotide-binding protein DprA/Smf involved in DNA uptake